MLNMGGMFGLGIMFQGVDNVSKIMGNIQRNMRFMEQASGKSITGLSKTIGSMTGSVAMATTGVGALKGSFALAQDAGKLESVIAGIDVITQASNEELRALSDWSIKDGTKLGYMATQSGEAMRNLATSGARAGEILQYMPMLSKFASANMMNMAQASNIAMQSLNAFSLSGEYLVNVLDQAQKAADMFALNIEDLEIGIARGLTGFKLVGASFTDFLAMYGLAKNVMPSSMMAGTGVSYAIQGLFTENPKKKAKIKQQLGIEIVADDGNYKEVDELMTEFFEKTKDMTDPQMNAFFSDVFDETGKKALVAIMSVLQKGIKQADGSVRKGVDAIRATWDPIMKSHHVVDEAWEKIKRTFEKKLDIMAATWNSFRIEVGKPMLLMWRPVIDKVTETLEKWREAFTALSPETQNFIAQIAVIGSSIAILAGSILTIGIGWGFIKFLFGAAASMLGSFLAAAWPVILVAGLIGGAFYLMNTQVGGFGEMLRSKFDGLTEFKSILTDVKDAAVDFWDGLVEGWNAVMDSVDFEFLRDGISALIDAVIEMWRSFGLGNGTMMWMKGFGAFLGGFVAVVVDIIGVLAGAIAYVFTGVAYIITDFVVPVISAIWTTIRGIMYGIAWAAQKVGAAFAWFTDSEFSAGESESVAGDIPVTDVEERWPERTGKRGAFGLRNTEQAPQSTPQATDIVPLSKVNPEPGPIASLRSQYDGVMPTMSESKAVIDYDKLAATFARTPLQVVLDGQRLVGIIERADRERRSRESA